MQSVSREMLEQEVPAPPPTSLPFSPNLWGLTVLLPSDSILCHSSLVYKQARLFKCHGEKDAAYSDLHIHSDHHSFLDPARKVSLPLPQLSIQSWKSIATLNLY